MTNNLPKIKLFLTDIDGVWTDGGMYYDEKNNELKKFNTADSAGVIFLRYLNIPTGILTGEKTSIVERRAEKLKIPYLFQGVTNKLKTASELCEKLQIKLKNVAYVGDDINDILLLKEVGLSAVPKDSPTYVSNYSDWILPVAKGQGVFRCFVERYLQETEKLETVLDLYLKDQKKGNDISAAI